MTNKRKKNNKFSISKMLENKLYIALGIIVLFILILIIGLGVSNNKEPVHNVEENTKASFIELKKSIELKVANLMLDGTVVDDESMEEKIEDINSLLEKEKWDKLDITCNVEFAGTWKLDENGMLKFKFDSKGVEPSWIGDTDVSEYIIEN